MRGLNDLEKRVIHLLTHPAPITCAEGGRLTADEEQAANALIERRLVRSYWCPTGAHHVHLEITPLGEEVKRLQQAADGGQG